jgi:hypothetical protein
MKVAAVIADDIIKDMQKFTGGKNITDSLVTALNDWLYDRRLDVLNKKLSNKPVSFVKGFSADGIRKLKHIYQIAWQFILIICPDKWLLPWSAMIYRKLQAQWFLPRRQKKFHGLWLYAGGAYKPK